MESRISETLWLRTLHDKAAADSICDWLYIMEYGSTLMEYGSTPYVGMAREKNGGPIQRIQNYTFRTRL